MARDIHFAHDRIDVLLNNAGSVFNKGERSVDGIEKTFATNHLAPFLLTNLLHDQLLAAPAARVVTVATEIYSRKLDFENLQGERSYNFFKAYQQSKLCNVLFAFELARRLDDTNVTSNVVSPGPSKTGFGANMKGPAHTFTRVMKATPRFGTPEKGARTLVYAATAPELDGRERPLLLQGKGAGHQARHPEHRDRRPAVADQLRNVRPRQRFAGARPGAVGLAGGRDSPRIAPPS